MKKILKVELINNICDSYCSRNRPESMNTDWGQSLLAYGFLSAYLKTGNKSSYNYLKKWLNYHITSGINPNYFVGSWSLALLFPEVTTVFPEHEFTLNSVAENIYSFILDKSLRNGSGIILHNIDLPHIYIDTIYYSTVALAKLGTYLNDDEWIEESIFQLAAHMAILKDKNSEFYIHCEQNLSGLRSDGAWARGNGWVIMTLCELLKYIPKKSKHKKSIEELLTDFIVKLVKYQTKNGVWRTIINDKNSYEESSASAMFLYGLVNSKKLNLISDKYDKIIEKCEVGMSKFIDSKNRLIGTSDGTWPGNADYYKALPTGEWWWGTGAYLLALCEI
jgi:unsaturated rhamnogalacturonyl hydrolase